MTRPHPTTLVALVALVAGCGLPDREYFGPVPTVDDPRHLRWCNSGEPDSLDPAEGQSTTVTPLMYALFDGLVIFGDDGLPEPGFAARWEVDPDQRRVTFHLRPEARWSNGRPLTAYDVAFQVVRVLHPATASVNADALDWMKNNLGYLEQRVRVLLRPSGGLPAGTIVDVTAVDGKALADWGDTSPPDPNARAARAPLALRDLGAPAAAAYATVPPGTTVAIIELSGRPATLPDPDGRAWAYVHWDRADGVYGWVPAAELDVVPSAGHRVRVVPVVDKQTPGLDRPWPELLADAAVARPEVEVDAADLLMLPEALGVRVPDPYTLVLEAADPTPSLVATSANRALRPTPREAVARRPRSWTRPETIVTSGPLHLTEHAQRDHLTLVRSPTYWNQADVALDRLTVLSIDDQAASANLYYTGACDAVTANHVPQSYLAALSTGNHGRPFRDYTVAPYLGSYFAIVNTQRFDNVHLRRALALALDRSRIATFLRGGEIAAASYTPGAPIASLSDEDLAACGVARTTPGVALVIERGALCYVPPRGLEFDPERARAELAIARREMGPRFPREVVYKFNVGFEAHKLVSEYLQAQWHGVLGIDVRLEQQEWQVFLNDTRALEYQLARLGWIGTAADPEVEFVRMWRCNGSNNRTGWCNPEFDRLLDLAATMTDPRARLAQVRAAEAILVDEAPIIPMFVYTQKNLRRPYVRGLPQNYIAQPPLWRAWRDPAWRTAPSTTPPPR
ncbi:MAG: peptide ABC transporter substrate-binding protein [Myxococcales bacterium]|nr:peptide ABC transporter substrate-binding protein [Myxococcales bacterium]